MAVAIAGPPSEVIVQPLSAVLASDPMPWDLTHDGIVDLFDLLIVVQRLGRFGRQADGDVNGDGVINILDVILVARHFGERAFDLAAAPALPGAEHRAAVGPPHRGGEAR
ncbi:MAG: hypothetical protein KatS3mg115_2394 [Candidatus Poribacteria bacterium]|nr:MAG: hypothetical protein KatS3mg115_2394 [Candidatus Poribacteria bacterium]